MPRRRDKSDDLEAIRDRLVKLLQNFEAESESGDLRSKVLELVSVHHLVRDLGGSLIPETEASSARDRILFYLLKYPKIVIRGEELAVVAGISEWARRVRELRNEHGWRIINGDTAKEMFEAGELPIDGIDASAMGSEDYILLDTKQDFLAARRWQTANEIRRGPAAARDKILEYLRRNVGVSVTGDELKYVAGDIKEWARRVRELRTESGWPISSKSSGRPDLPVGVYFLERDRQTPPHDRTIPDAVRSAVLMRDKYKCQNCGWSQKLWDPSDPRHLEPHHIKHHAEGGTNTPDNLITLCSVCHDERHAKEKH